MVGLFFFVYTLRLSKGGISMTDVKPTFQSKTVLTGIAVMVAGALGLADVVTPAVVEAAVLVFGALVVVFRRKATAVLG
jgi:hypothetical protein